MYFLINYMFTNFRKPADAYLFLQFLQLISFQKLPYKLYFFNFLFTHIWKKNKLKWRNNFSILTDTKFFKINQNKKNTINFKSYFFYKSFYQLNLKNYYKLYQNLNFFFFSNFINLFFFLKNLDFLINFFLIFFVRKPSHLVSFNLGTTIFYKNTFFLNSKFI